MEKSIEVEIPVCNIMGVNVAAINMEWLMEYIEKNISKCSGNYICVANVHTTVSAYEDKDYLAVQNGGLMAIPDGGPLSSVGRKRGHADMQRVTGPSFMEEVLHISSKKGWKHFFYGSTDDTLATMRNVIEARYPGVIISGMYSPPFRELSEEENIQILDMINSANPDFVWVGLGAPKQEKWMAEHKGKVNGLMVGVGAAFNYLAGNITRAPLWMQNANLEWVYRLYQEPKRLFKRYWHTNSKFIYHVYFRGE